MIRRSLAMMVIAAVGCRSAEGVDPATVRDSAGVRIVESHRPSAPGSIRVDSIPAVDIGGEAAGTESEFISMIASAHRFPDGRIAASGWAMTAFKMFDSTGKWIRTVGRQGAGPGEFEGLGWVYPASGDTLITFEPGRLQWFDSTGTFVRFQNPTAAAGQGGGWIRAVFADGSMLAEQTANDPTITNDKVIGQRSTLRRYWPAQSRYDSIISYFVRLGLRNPQYPGTPISELLFTPSAVRATSGDAIYLAPGDRFEITRFDPAGRPNARYRLEVPSVSVTDQDRDKATEWLQSVDSTIRDRVRADLLAASTAQVKPPIYSMWAASDGRLWVRYGDQKPAGPPRVAVFDSTGRWVTDTSIPADLEINEIGGDYLLGYRKDEQGFFHVLMFRIHRS